ncbi:MAG: copper chaperone PCu(A)C [Xanthobacteraceae bacterium]
MRTPIECLRAAGDRAACLLRPVGLALLIASAWTAGALAHSHKIKGFEIVHPWCFEITDPAVSTAAVYMIIKNQDRRPDRLIGATSAAAQTIELRTPVGDGTHTRKASGLDVKGGQELILRSSGPHLLLSGLARKPAAYESFAMTLIFERAGRIEVEVMVEEARKGEPAPH